jgi:hypothetical protein
MRRREFTTRQGGGARCDSHGGGCPRLGGDPGGPFALALAVLGEDGPTRLAGMSGDSQCYASGFASELIAPPAPVAGARGSCWDGSAASSTAWCSAAARTSRRRSHRAAAGAGRPTGQRPSRRAAVAPPLPVLSWRPGQGRSAALVLAATPRRRVGLGRLDRRRHLRPDRNRQHHQPMLGVHRLACDHLAGGSCPLLAPSPNVYGRR